MNRNEIFNIARIVHADVSTRMRGRMGDPGVDNAATVGAFAAMGGPGDYIEIGTLWGGSAMVVAIMKKMFDVPGSVYCLDPLDGYHIHEGLFVPNERMEAPVTLDTLMENAAIFDVEDMIIPVTQLSYPWPDVLERNVFTVSYIDGDHTGEAPLKDWTSVSQRTSKYVLFDNHEEKYPAVVEACKSISYSKSWKLLEIIGITCIFERVP